MQLPNYRAWEINPNDFAQAITPVQQARFIIQYAVLAPNSHNTQPWHFRIYDGGQTIDLRPDFSRSIPCSDPQNRQLYLSLGAALGNLCVAAAYFGFDPQVSYPYDEVHSTLGVRIELRKRPGHSFAAPLHARAALFPFIVQRRMNRAPYEDRSIEREILENLRAYNEERTVSVSFVEKNSPLFAQFLSLIHQGTVATQSDPGIIEEWGRWFRSVDTLEYDGVPPFDFPIPDSVLSVMEQAQRTQTLFATAPVFLILGAEIDDPVHWVRTGKALSTISLAAEQLGISQAPWGAVVEHDASAQQAARLLGIDHILYFARLGYAESKPHHSPRRPVEEVLLRA